MLAILIYEKCKYSDNVTKKNLRSKILKNLLAVCEISISEIFHKISTNVFTLKDIFRILK